MIASHVLGRGRFERHLVGRAFKSASRKKSLIIGLTLTSMVDMFSLLVIFLLQTFSNSPEVLNITKGITLPVAATGSEVKDAPVLSISPEGIFLDQKFVGYTNVVLKDPTALLEKLETLRNLWLKTHPDATQFPGEITIIAHKEIPSTTVSQLMAIVPGQNYSSIQLAVVSTGGGT